MSSIMKLDAEGRARAEYLERNSSIDDLAWTVAYLEAQVQTLRETAYKTIDCFQDMTSWQPGESRNALVIEIRNAVDAALAATETK